jgi:hypothetical protein
VQLISDGSRAVARHSVPMIGFSQAGKAGHFDAAGFPIAMAEYARVDTMP